MIKHSDIILKLWNIISSGLALLFAMVALSKLFDGETQSFFVFIGIAVLFIPKLQKMLLDKTESLPKTIGIIVAAFFIFVLFHPTAPKTAAASSKTDVKVAAEKTLEAKPAPGPQVMQVGIHHILSAYAANEVGADNQYKDKIIEVTGIVDSVSKGIWGGVYVTIGTGAIFEIPQIQASFDDSMNKQLGQLKKGQRLTVVCRVSGLMMNVHLKDCIIK